MNTVIIIAGPTASGKSQLAIDLALELNGVILNADAMQIYQGTPILSATPKNEDKQGVEHRLYEFFPNNYSGSVVDWIDNIVPEIRKVWAENRVPIVVGGTGLYIDNLINGVTPIPQTKESIRRQVEKFIKEKGVRALHEELKNVDPQTAEKLSPNDTTRVRRAYEVWQDTGVPLSVWHKKNKIKKLAEAKFFVIRLLPSQKELDERCYLRFDEMLKQGALEEIKKISKQNLDENLPAMKALGVPELLAYIKGEKDFEQAVEEAKLHTRQYAKRQLTWFRKQLQSDFDIFECYRTDNELIKNVIFNVKKQI